MEDQATTMMLLMMLVITIELIITVGDYNWIDLDWTYLDWEDDQATTYYFQLWCC